MQNNSKTKQGGKENKTTTNKTNKPAYALLTKMRTQCENLDAIKFIYTYQKHK